MITPMDNKILITGFEYAKIMHTSLIGQQQCSKRKATIYHVHNSAKRLQFTCLLFNKSMHRRMLLCLISPT